VPHRGGVVNRAEVVARCWRARGAPSALGESETGHLALAARLFAHFGLAAPDAPSPPPAAGPMGKPAFGDFRTADAPALIAGLGHAGPARERSLEWCERLMRYCEVFRFDLERRALEKWGGEQAARRGLLCIAALLAEATLASGDCRYLNTALKLLDRPRLFDERRFGRDWGGEDMVATHAVLAGQAALDGLGSGPHE
jgi:hypothetical protein